MPADKYNRLASITLFDAVNDGFRLSTHVCCFNNGSKGEWGMWFSSTSALDIETVGFDIVSIDKLLGLEGQR